MASLMDLLTAGFLPQNDAPQPQVPVAPPDDPMARLLAMLKPGAAATTPTPTPGVSVTPPTNGPSFGTLAPNAPPPIADNPAPSPSGLLSGLSAAAQPVLAAASSQPAPQVTGSIPKPTPSASSGEGLSGGDLLKTGLAFLGGLSGRGGISSALAENDMLGERNATRAALMRKGVSADDAEAMSRNPTLLQQIAPVLFGNKAAQLIDLGNDPTTGQPVKGLMYPGGRIERLNLGDVPDQNGQVGNTGSAGDMTVNGPAYLDSLHNPARAGLIKAIVEGREAPPAARQLATPQGQFLMQQVSQYEPGFDLTKWTARNATAKSFGAGTDAQAINNFNTAVNHLGHLSTAIDALGNTQIPLIGSTVNWAKNAYESASGDPAITNFDAARKAVLDEVASVFSGKNGSGVGDRAEWESKINSSQSPAQLHGVVNELIDLMDGRLSSLADKYNQGMSTANAPRHFLTPEAQATLDRIQGRTPAKSYPTVRRVDGVAAGQAVDTPIGASIPGATPDGQSQPNADQQASILQQARQAIAAGKDPAAVKARLQQNGIDPGAL